MISAGDISLTVLEVKVRVRYTIIIVLSIFVIRIIRRQVSSLNNLDDLNWKSDYAAVHRRYDRSETVVSPRCCHIERMYLGCYRTSEMSAF